MRQVEMTFTGDLETNFSLRFTRMRKYIRKANQSKTSRIYMDATENNKIISNQIS